MDEQVEPVRDVAHLAHVELFSADLEGSIGYFHDVLGMEVAAERGDSVYMRCYGDHDVSSLKLTRSELPGVGHVSFRTWTPQALERRVAALDTGGVDGWWVEGDVGHGRAYQFRGADGHVLELYYDTERYTAPAHLKPALKNQPDRYPGRGVGVQRLDHVNLLAVKPAADREFLERFLGLRLVEQIVLDDGTEAAVWLTSGQKSYDIVYTRDATGTPGRFHHIAFWAEQREDVLRGADICLEHGIEIESGPHKHAINQTFFLYTWEPGGNRIELATGGYMVFAPDWEPIVWTQAERAKGQAWGMQTTPSFHIRGTPPVPKEAELLAAHN